MIRHLIPRVRLGRQSYSGECEAEGRFVSFRWLGVMIDLSIARVR